MMCYIIAVHYQNQKVNSQRRVQVHSLHFIHHVAFISVYLGQFLSLPFKLMAWALGEFRPVVLRGVA